MQIIDNSSVGYKHFFLQGYRAEAAGAGFDGTDVEKVGVLVVKQGMNAAGAVLNDEEVLLTDKFYDPADPHDPADPAYTPHTELIRLESDIAVTKPGLDVVVVNLNSDVPEFAPPPVKPFFGNVQINRVGGSSDALALLDFGWRLRTESPGRREESGDAGSFVPDVNQPGKLPAKFNNTFFNGGRNATLNKVLTGDLIVFEEIEVDRVTLAGFKFELLIPAAPQINFTKDAVPLDPQPVLEYGVDTVVLDQTAVGALFVWRAVFAWSDDFETAVLEIN